MLTENDFDIKCLFCDSTLYADQRYSEGYNQALENAIKYFTEHAKEVYDHVSARDFICDRLEEMLLY